ncbi:hypothetical protein CKF46_36385, partial [Klebsiella pneumoniae]
IKLVKLLQQEQRLILDEFSHVSAVFCCFVIRGLRASVLSVRMFSFRFLAHSVATLCRSAAASGRSMRRNAEKTEQPHD